MYKVGFIVKKTGVFVENTYDCYKTCEKFVNKCKHSPNIILVYYPNFYE